MKFGEFLEYVEKYDSGKLWRDMTYKNYDLLWQASEARLRRALALCGFCHDEISVSLAECATRVCERGFHLGTPVVKRCLLEWFVWRKLEGGEYRKWKYKNLSGTNATAERA